VGDQPKRETWLEWVPGSPELNLDALLSREEIIALLNVGDEVSETSLRYWESCGVLPQPVRRRKNGATRALYPLWYAALVRRLREYQTRGFTLEELPSRMHAEARQLAVSGTLAVATSAGSLSPSAREFTNLFRQYAVLAESTPHGYPFRTIPLPAELERPLRETLVLLAASHRRRDGVEIESAEISLKDRHGQTISYNLAIGADVEDLIEQMQQYLRADTPPGTRS